MHAAVAITNTTAATNATKMDAKHAAMTNSSGLETLFREHHALVFRAAYRITGSAADAEDVLQTIFLRLMRSDAQTDFSPNPAGYLHRAAVNAALDSVRSRTRSKQVALEEVEAALFSNTATNPEAAYSARELRQFIAYSVSHLGERTAEIFALRYFEDYDNREIARITGTTQMVVAVVLHRARTRLRRELGEFLEKYNETN